MAASGDHPSVSRSPAIDPVDPAGLAATHAPPWWHQSLARVNDCLFRMAGDPPLRTTRDYWTTIWPCIQG
jgi:hypothetical protein